MNIVNFGSLNLDYVYRVPHVVQAGETLSSTALTLFSGGKGLNQSVAAARAGATVYHAGILGSDGATLRNELEHNGVNLKYLQKENIVSGHAIIQVDYSGQNCIIIHSGANAALTRKHIDKILLNIQPEDIVLMQNETSNVAYLMKKTRETGACVAFNPSPITSELLEYPLECVDIFLLNEIEAQSISRSESRDEIVRGLKLRFPQSEIVLTLGKEGVLYCKGDTTYQHGIYDVPVIDTTGAGDTFCGYFLAGKAMGLPVEECIRRASIASSIAVSREGAAPSIPALEEVLSCSLTPKSICV